MEHLHMLTLMSREAPRETQPIVVSPNMAPVMEWLFVIDVLEPAAGRGRKMQLGIRQGAPASELAKALVAAAHAILSPETTSPGPQPQEPEQCQAPTSH